MFATTSHTLIEKIQDTQNDELWNDSWRRFLRIYHGPMSYSVTQAYRRYTGGLKVDPCFVEDILAAVYTDLFRKSVAKYDRGQGKLSTYLRTIVSRKVIDHLRKEKPFERHTSIEELTLELPDESEDEVREYENVLLVEVLNSLRGEVSHRQFNILERVGFHGEKVAEVANDLGMKPENVSRELYKAKAKLTELVKQHPNLREAYYA